MMDIMKCRELAQQARQENPEAYEAYQAEVAEAALQMIRQIEQHSEPTLQHAAVRERIFEQYRTAVLDALERHFPPADRR